jgi:hypothetical protein
MACSRVNVVCCTVSDMGYQECKSCVTYNLCFMCILVTLLQLRVIWNEGQFLHVLVWTYNGSHTVYTFSNLYLLVCVADKTENLIGISETLVLTSAAGILFALVAGQPLIIIGTTGPLLLFDESLYTVSLNCHFFPISACLISSKLDKVRW